MEITKIENFLAYYENTRKITKNVLSVIPPDMINWSYMPNKFTIGDLVRHIAAIERHVFAEVAIGNKPNYQGCGIALADGLENIISYFNEMHKQTVAIFMSLSDESLNREITSLDGKQIRLGNFLRALIVHEIHHRGALCIYLNLIGVTTPPIIGLMEEQVIQLSK